jgi:hypothetical protein
MRSLSVCLALVHLLWFIEAMVDGSPFNNDRFLQTVCGGRYNAVSTLYSVGWKISKISVSTV